MALKVIASMTERESPMYSVEDERTVIGAVLIDPAALRLALAAGLLAAHFSDVGHRLIWESIERLSGDGQHFGMVPVYEELVIRGHADRIGGLGFLNDLCAAVEATKAAGACAAVVVDRARRRELVELADQIKAAAKSTARADDLAHRVVELQGRLAGSVRAGMPRSAIPLEWVSEMPLELRAPPQIVEGVLTAGGISMMFGESNSGKSYLAIHLAICVSLGLPWLGQRTRKMAVLYVAAEGAWSIRLRLAAYRQHFGHPPGAFGLIPCPLSLIDPSVDVEELIGLVKAESAKLGEPIGLIVIDTVARVMAGGDENSALDMGRLVGAADRIRQATGAHLLFIHHAGKDASRGARGHSSLRAALDTEIEVSADDASKTHTAKVTKQRDLPSRGETFAARFVPVELGFDQWDSAITACAVVRTEVDAAAAGRPRLSHAQQAVLAYLAGRDTGTKRAVIVAALEPQGKSRTAVYRAIGELAMAGLIYDTAGMIYAPRQ